MTNITGKMVYARIGHTGKLVFFSELPRVDDIVVVDNWEYIVASVVWEKNQDIYGNNTIHHPTVHLASKIAHDYEKEESWRDRTSINLKELRKHGLSARAHNALKRGGYTYIQDIVGADEKELEYVDNFGKKSLLELEKAIVNWRKGLIT